jgi:hypothetical protein
MDVLGAHFAVAGVALGSASILTWLGVILCLAQAAVFSGLNLAVFSVSRLRLEVEAAGGNRDAIKVLGLRRQSNLTRHHSLGQRCRERVAHLAL